MSEESKCPHCDSTSGTWFDRTYYTYEGGTMDGPFDRCNDCGKDDDELPGDDKGLKGAKYDTEKPAVDLLPTLALEEIAKVLNHGKKKYHAWNWAGGFEWSRLIGAAERHLFAFQRGEDLDPESQLNHLAHLGCTLLFLLEHYLRGLGKDDRYKFKK